MVSISWCIRQKDGLELIEPNINVSRSYAKMAEESIETLPGVANSRIWTAVASYYIFYYSLYSLMMRIGVKCEIHSCSLEFMRQYLHLFYSKEDSEMINKAMKARIDLQYYADRPVDAREIEKTSKYCKIFFIKTNDLISMLTEAQIKQVRESIQKEIFLAMQKQSTTGQAVRGQSVIIQLFEIDGSRF